METEEVIEGPTPAGGVRSRAYFRNAEGAPVNKQQATQVEIEELDEDGKVIQRTYMTKG